MKLLSLLAILLFIRSHVYGQDLLIYHGTKGTSSVVEGYLPNSTSIEYKAKVGEEVIVRIINAHPALYSYEFTSKEVEIENPELPDFSSLISVLTGELGLKTNESTSARVGISVSIRPTASCP